MSGLPQTLFQSGKDEPYSGEEKRGNRVKLSKELETVVEIFKRELKENTGCGECPIPEEFKPDIPHVLGAIKEIGKDNFSAGVDAARDQHKKIASILSTMDNAKGTVLTTVLKWIVYAILGALVLGIYQKIWMGI